MAIIEIYSDSIESLWHNDETFLCVFDEKNNLIEEYDFCNGLKLLKKDKKMIIYINDFDFVLGKWTFFATKSTKINDEYVKEKIKISGENLSNNSKTTKEKNIVKECSPEKHVSLEEREERLSICKKCPFFDKENMACSVNNEIVLKITKYENEYCPEKKWGDEEKVKEKIVQDAISRGDIIITQTQEIDKKDQENFEAELEEYLRGL